MMLGGTSEAKSATPEVQEIANRDHFFSASCPAKKHLVKMMLGGTSEAKPATPEVQEIANRIKPQLEEKTNEKYEKFEAVEYKTQVVAGKNYFIKIDVGNGRYIHLRVFQGLSGEDNYELHGYETNKQKDDELIYF